MSRFTDLLGDFQAEKHFLGVLEPYDPAAGATSTLNLSSHGFNSEPGDVPSSTYYAPRLKSAYTFERALFAAGRLSGRSVPAAGTLVLNNDDGGLDGLASLAWGGRRVRILLGGAGFALAEHGLIFDGTAQGIAFGDQDVTVNLRDLAYVFDREIQPTQFAGTGGVEGGADLKGRRKPITLGVARTVPGVFLGVDTGLYRYALGDGPIVGVLAVYDNGAPLAYAASPAAGQWSVDLASGVVALGGAPAGTVTFDVIGSRYLSLASATAATIGTGTRTWTVPAGQRLAVGTRVRAARTSDLAGTWMDGRVTAYSGTSLTVAVDGAQGSGSASDWTISPWGTTAGILRRIAASLGVTAFDDTMLSALDLWQPATVGLWLPEGGNAGQVLDQIADGTGSYWGFDRGGLFEAGRVEAPSTASASYGSTQILALERLATAEPSWQVAVRYRRAWQVLSADQLAGVADANKTLFTTEWRTATAQSAATLAAYPLSSPIEIDSLFDLEADAVAEASRQLALFGVRRDYMKARLKVQPLAGEIGDTVRITHPRYGFSAGRALRLVDLTEDMDAYEVTMGLWG